MNERLHADVNLFDFLLDLAKACPKQKVSIEPEWEVGDKGVHAVKIKCEASVGWPGVEQRFYMQELKARNDPAGYILKAMKKMCAAATAVRQEMCNHTGDFKSDE